MKINSSISSIPPTCCFSSIPSAAGSRGHWVSVVSRRKGCHRTTARSVCRRAQDDIQCRHRPVQPGVELLRRDIALLGFARQFRPDVMVGFGGVAISHVGKWGTIGQLYDTERAPLQHRLTLPLISHLHVPASYDGPIARNRTSRFPSTKDFSYLHPDNFAPVRSIAEAAGLAPVARTILSGWLAGRPIMTSAMRAG